MKRQNKYFLNALLLSLVTVAMRGVSVSFNAYITQKIGSEAVGLFTLVMSVYTLAVTLACSGVNLAAVRMTAYCLAECEKLQLKGALRKRVLFSEMAGCIKYSLFFGLFAFALLFLLAELIGTRVLCDERTVPSLKALSFALPFISLSSAISGYFTGLRKISKNAVTSLWEQLVKIVTTTAALLVIAPRGIEYACLSVVGGCALSEAASLIMSVILFLTDKNRTNDEGTTLPILKGSPLGRAFDIAFPTAMGAYVRQGLTCAEHIAIPSGLRRFGAGDKSALASYGTIHAMAFPLIFFPSSVISAFASLLIPELCECAALGDSKRVARIARKVLSVSLIFSVGCAGVFLAFGRDMGLSIYNDTEAGAFICAFAPLVPVMYMDTAVDSVLKGLGMQTYCMKVNIIDSFISLVLVLLLVPRLGAWGYVICVYIAELVNAALSITKMLSLTGVSFSPSWVAMPLAFILLSTVSVKLLCEIAAPFDATYLKILLCALIYSALIILKSHFQRQKSYKRENPQFTP